MALNVNELATLLATMPPSTKDEEVANNFANVWTTYFSKADIGGIAANPSALNISKAAMIKKLIGISIDGPKVIQEGITAFWASIVATAPTVWITAPNVLAPVTPSLNLALIETLLKVEIAKNILGAPIFQEIANVLHNNGGVGATATLTPPTGTPIISPIM